MKSVRNCLLVTLLALLFYIDLFAGNFADFTIHSFLADHLRPLLIGHWDCVDDLDCQAAAFLSLSVSLFIVGVLVCVVVDDERKWIWTGVAAAEILVPLFWFSKSMERWTFLQVVGAALIGIVLGSGLAGWIVRRMVFRRQASHGADVNESR